MIGALSSASQISAHSLGVADGVEMARSISEARRAVLVAREPNSLTSRTAGKRRKMARSTSRSLVLSCTASVPREGLDAFGHAVQKRSVSVTDALADSFCE